MTMFDIRALHGNTADTVRDAPGSVIEVDYYYANEILLLSDEDIVAKAKADLDILLGSICQASQVVDAAVVRLPEGVNWYFPGSYINFTLLLRLLLFIEEHRVDFGLNLFRSGLRASSLREARGSFGLLVGLVQEC